MATYLFEGPNEDLVDPNNWTTGVAPGAGDTGQITSAANGIASKLYVGANAAWGALELTTVTNTVTIASGGARITYQPASSPFNTLVVPAGKTLNYYVAYTLPSGAHTWAIDGTLTVTMNLTGSSSTVLRKTGEGTATITSRSTEFSGALQVTAGTLVLSAPLGFSALATAGVAYISGVAGVPGVLRVNTSRLNNPINFSSSSTRVVSNQGGGASTFYNYVNVAASLNGTGLAPRIDVGASKSDLSLASLVTVNANSTLVVGLDNGGLLDNRVSFDGGVNGAGRLELFSSSDSRFYFNQDVAVGAVAVYSGKLYVALNVTVANPIYLYQLSATEDAGCLVVDSNTAVSSLAVALAEVHTSSTGVLGLAQASSENVNLSAYPGLQLGPAGNNLTYSGTITPSGGVYNLRGREGFTFTVTSAFSGSGTVYVRGKTTNDGVTFANTTNSFTGALRVESGKAVLLSSTAFLSGNIVIGTTDTDAYLQPTAQDGNGYILKAKRITVGKSGLNGAPTGIICGT